MTPYRLLLGLTISAGLVLLTSIGAGEVLSRAAARPVGAAPADLQALTVSLPGTAGQQVRGWLVPASTPRGAVLLLHGVRADRRQMVERARLFSRQGYAVLLIDLPAHGESTGDRISFGLREADGVSAALAYLRQHLPGTPLAVVGVSLGAAALVLAKPRPAPDAVVLESM